MPRLYSDLAAWWPLFSPPDHHEEEAEWLLGVLDTELGRRPASLLELGSGGGNTASHLGNDLALTLVDVAPAMLAVSRALNPRATHVEGDMRTVRLGATFDVVMIHDAIMYMTGEDELVAALRTARTHVAADGIAVVLPDYVAPADGTVTHHVDLAILLRAADGTVEAVHDRHTYGLFPRALWCTAFERAGFAAPTVTPDWWQRDVFLAKPG
jgi:SAM-dependent methyltransferase